MVIRNKDGSIYQLQTPNPLTREQKADWDSPIILHNCNWGTIEGEAPKDVQPIESDLVLKTSDNIEKQYIELVKDLEEKDETPDLENVLDPTTLPVNEPVVLESPTTPQPQTADLQNKVLMHCLPATTKESYDMLYGEHKLSVEYGEKFTFESVVFEFNDLVMKFWTNLDIVTPHSVVFPYGYSDGGKFKAFRWWKITSREPAAGGYMLDAIPSTVQPDFS